MQGRTETLRGQGQGQRGHPPPRLPRFFFRDEF